MISIIVKKCFFILIILFISQNIFSKDLYPQDVTSFIEKRDQCDHLRGEISGEPEIDNARNLNVELDKYCKGTDKLLEALKLKYKDNDLILKKLNAYEEIECITNCTTHTDTATMTRLVDIVRFTLINNEHNLWQSGNYIFKCSGETGYDCELFFNQNKKLAVHLFREYDVVDFLPYIYQSKVKDYPYKVILIEAGAERGTAWYYVIVLKDNDVVDSFFIDQGRRYFAVTKEYLAKHPEADEMYISPEEFISVFIDDGKQIIFKFDRKYLYSSEIPVEEMDKDFLYIHRELSEDIKN